MRIYLQIYDSKRKTDTTRRIFYNTDMNFYNNLVALFTGAGAVIEHRRRGVKITDKNIIKWIVYEEE